MSYTRIEAHVTIQYLSNTESGRLISNVANSVLYNPHMTKNCKKHQNNNTFPHPRGGIHGETRAEVSFSNGTFKSATSMNYTIISFGHSSTIFTREYLYSSGWLTTLVGQLYIALSDQCWMISLSSSVMMMINRTDLLVHCNI